MNSDKIKAVGKEGENAALNYLLNRGHVVAETNYWSRTGEIDIIYWDQDCLVFAEVKSSMEDSKYALAERVNVQKQKRLIATALDYMSKHKPIVSGYRFDVILLNKLKADEWKIEHIKDAFWVNESNTYE